MQRDSRRNSMDSNLREEKLESFEDSRRDFLKLGSFSALTAFAMALAPFEILREMNDSADRELNRNKN